MKIMWYGEYDVTWEWVQTEPRLEFMPMEASLLFSPVIDDDGVPLRDT